MAIGDTINAGLLRTDYSPFNRAGVARGNVGALTGMTMGMLRPSPPRSLESNLGTPPSGGSPTQNMESNQQKALQNEFLRRLSGTAQTDELTPEAEEKLQKGINKFSSDDPRRKASVNDIEKFTQRIKEDPNNYKTINVSDLEGNEFLNNFRDDPRLFGMAFDFNSKRIEAELANQEPQKIARMITVQDDKGDFTQVGVDEAGNPIRDFGPPKPSGMYRTPEEARKEEILVGRTKDAMALNKLARENSNIAISQAEQAQQALKYLPETTGGLTSFVNEMKVIGESLGIDLPEGYQKDMADIGAFRQLTGQFLFDAMSNTKGAITEREMVLFRQIAPDIDNSRAANKLMLEIYVKAGERAKLRRDLIRDLQNKNVDPRQIQTAVEDFDDENSFMDDIRSLPRKTNQNSPPQAQPNRPGVRRGNPQPSQGSQTSGGFQIKTR